MVGPCCFYSQRRGFWLRDEEQFLLRNLDGYGGYCSRVRFRLVPGLW
jgi:protein-S-isoprenylcysteine O-methyltransferase Ste14